MFLNADVHFALNGEVCLPILPQNQEIYQNKKRVPGLRSKPDVDEVNIDPNQSLVKALIRLPPEPIV